MNLLSVSDLKTPVFGPVSFILSTGQTISLSGPSGAGKSRLLRAIADLDPHTGNVLLETTPSNSIPPSTWRKQVGLLAAESYWWHEQVGDHFTHKNTLDVSTLGFEPDVMNWQVSRLSSGERQRLALLRLLDNQPRVLLLDEPSANLDAINVERVETLINKYQEDHDTGILWVSHDAMQIQRIADQQLLLENGTLTERAATT